MTLTMDSTEPNRRRSHRGKYTDNDDYDNDDNDENYDNDNGR